MTPKFDHDLRVALMETIIAIHPDVLANIITRLCKEHGLNSEHFMVIQHCQAVLSECMTKITEVLGVNPKTVQDPVRRLVWQERNK